MGSMFIPSSHNIIFNVLLFQKKSFNWFNSNIYLIYLFLFTTTSFSFCSSSVIFFAIVNGGGEVWAYQETHCNNLTIVGQSGFENCSYWQWETPFPLSKFASVSAFCKVAALIWPTQIHEVGWRIPTSHCFIEIVLTEWSKNNINSILSSSLCHVVLFFLTTVSNQC